MRRALLTALFTTLLALTACSSDPDDPETRIRAVIASAEEAAEDRSTRQVMRHVSENYQDQSGRDYDGLRDLVRLYLLRHQNPRILSRIRSVELLTPFRAEVALLAGMADTGGGRLQANTFEITLSLDLEEDGEWRVISAQWRRAGQEAGF